MIRRKNFKLFQRGYLLKFKLEMKSKYLHRRKVIRGKVDDKNFDKHRVGNFYFKI